MKTVLVFFGGQSPEHDVSVLTGVMTLNSVDKDKFNAIPVYVARDGGWFTGDDLNDVESYKRSDAKKLKRVCIVGGDNSLYLVKGKKIKKLCSVACAINCLHGVKGEDGALKGLLDMSAIPVVGSPLLASSAAMDKAATKIFLKGLNIKTLPYVIYDKDTDFDLVAAKFGYPVMVKPANLGSSIGVNKAANKAELERSVNKAKKFDDKIILEKCAGGKLEINAAAYKGKNGIVVSECEMPATQNKFLTFEDKYVSGERTFPAPISKKLSDKIKEITKKIYASLWFSGVIRVDFLVTEGVPYVNEINTTPGSLAYYLFTDTFAGFKAMLTEMIEVAMGEFYFKNTLISRFDCDILKNAGGKGGKRFDN